MTCDGGSRTERAPDEWEIDSGIEVDFERSRGSAEACQQLRLIGRAAIDLLHDCGLPSDVRRTLCQKLDAATTAVDGYITRLA